MMKKTFIAAFIGALSSFALAQQTGLPTTQLSVAGKQILAELATNDQQRQIGLMFRKSLPKNDGMLFLFEQDRTVCMWMENTLIPLSVAFIGIDGKIVNIEDMQPLTRNLHCSLGPVKYVLEMNQGWFKRNKVEIGASFTGLPGLH